MKNANTDRVLNLKSWHDDWRGLKIAVLGLGVTGFSVADTVAELGAEVLVIAKDVAEEMKPLLHVIGASLAQLQDDSKQLQELESFNPDLVVVSPGYPLAHPLTVWAEAQKIPVWGDIELAWRLRDKTERIADWICVTGTNGKTTTSQLTAHMLVAGGLKAAPVGNIGTPILDAIRDPEGFDVLVVELSSFQLARLGYISPYSSVCLNISDDHLDWHGGFDEYVKAKAKIYENTQVACVYNRQDQLTEKMVEDAEVIEGARAISFGLDTPSVSGFGTIEGILIDRGFHPERRNSALELYGLDELAAQNLDAPHLVQDILAASALARSRGVTPEQIAEALRAFSLDDHRMQLVFSDGENSWVDDSKATNAHAADASLRSYKRVIWVVGGLLKGQKLDQLIIKHKKRFSAIIVIGKQQDEVLDSINKNAKDIKTVLISPENEEDVMSRVISAAKELVKPGDVVLLSPAAASMDQFLSFEDRGRKFQEAVIKLVAGDETGGRKA